MINHPNDRRLALMSFLLPRIFLVMACVLPSMTKAADFPPPEFTEMGSEQSPGGSFRIIHFKRDPNDYSSASQVWLQALKPEFKTQLLFTHSNRAGWLISPDDDFIAINHHVGSGVGLLHVYSRDKDGLYHEKKKDFLEAAEKLMRTQLKLKEEIDLDHMYCSADSWLRDGLLLGHIDGHKSGTCYVGGWYFIYDVMNDRFLWDLSQINHHALRVDLPDDSRLAQVDEVDAVPSISKVFETLQFLMPLPREEVARKLPERMPMEREDLALELGFLIADGFLVVQTEQLERVGELAEELTRYAKALGVGSRVSPHAAGLMELARNKNVPQLKEELAAMQSDLAIEWVLLKDEDLAHLITLGGWIRGFEVAVAAVDQRFTPERARTVMREDLADYYAGVVGGMEALLAKRPKFLAMRDVLAELRHAMTLAQGQKPTAAQVSAIRNQAAKLVALALQRQQ